MAHKLDLKLKKRRTSSTLNLSLSIATSRPMSTSTSSFLTEGCAPALDLFEDMERLSFGPFAVLRVGSFDVLFLLPADRPDGLGAVTLGGIMP